MFVPVYVHETCVKVQVSGHYFIASAMLLLELGCYSFVGVFFGSNK